VYENNFSSVEAKSPFGSTKGRGGEEF
ncbi:hypothetical protein A2U01_0072630, partial [Trifolium medium]|nr:hypothetical protein [Trifolium medium]